MEAGELNGSLKTRIDFEKLLEVDFLNNKAGSSKDFSPLVSNTCHPFILDISDSDRRCDNNFY